MKKYILAFLIAFSGLFAQAQLYNQGVGFRGGETFGFTYQKFVMPDEAVMGILSFRDRGTQVTGLYKAYKPFVSLGENFFWYYGFGGHLGISATYADDPYYYEGVYHPRPFRRRVPYMEAGFDGNIGVEYRFPKLPFTLSLDAKPYMNILGRWHDWGNLWDVGFAAQYTF